jgi:hypothetical protein
MFYLHQLPVPRLTAADAAFAPIVERSAKLICTTPEFDELAVEAGLSPLCDHSGRAAERSGGGGERSAGAGERSGGDDERSAGAGERSGRDDERSAGAGERSAGGGERSGTAIRGPIYGVTDPAERAKLRAELDAMVAHLYGLTDDQFAHVLETFPLVNPAVRAAALNEFTRMIETGEAATFNPELAKPVVAGGAVVADPAAAVKDLIAKGESATLEFKATARWDVKQNKPGPYLERVIVKTVAAFLNAKGGTLIIGVEDDGKAYGLHEDYKLCGNKGRDGFENWLMKVLMIDFGKDAAAQLAVEFHQIGTADEAKPGSADVCVMTVLPSPKPRFATENGQELFYVRTGNATNQLKLSELLAYCKERWPETAAAV